MTKFSQINKKFKIILAFSLFGVLSENAFAAGIDNLIENNNANLPKHQYKLIFEKDKKTHESQDFLLNDTCTKRGNQLLASYAQAKYRLPKQYDIRLSIAKTISEANTIFPVYNDGNLGATSANAAAGALQFKRIYEKLSNYVPSRLMIYYNERKDNGLDVTQDTGDSISDAVAAIVKWGACNETLWPYSDSSTSTPNFTQQPSATCYKNALRDMDLDNVAHANIPQDKNTLQAFKNSLYNNNPILIGINMYPSFISSISTGGIIPMPNLQTEVILGPLALMATGYNDKTSLFTVRSSFGATYVGANGTKPIGDYGYFYLPYDYLTNPDLAADFWIVAKVGTHTKSTIYSNLACYSSYAFSTTKYIVSAPFKVLSYLKSTFIG